MYYFIDKTIDPKTGDYHIRPSEINDCKSNEMRVPQQAGDIIDLISKMIVQQYGELANLKDDVTVDGQLLIKKAAELCEKALKRKEN